MKEENREEQMNKRRETMPDGKRYIVYYTFGDESETNAEKPDDSEKSEEEKSV